jgi:hypothetical protein
LTNGFASLNPNDNRLYLTFARKVHVVDLKDNILETSIDFSNTVAGIDSVGTIKVNPKTNKLYVSLLGREAGGTSGADSLSKGVAVVNLTNNSIVVPSLSGSSINTPSMFSGRFIEFDDISNVVYVGFIESKDLLMYDAVTNTLLRTFSLPLGPLETIFDIEFVEGKGGLYISTDAKRLIRVDTQNIRNDTQLRTTVLGAVSGERLTNLTANPDTNKLYAYNDATKKLIVFDLSNNTILEQLDIQVGSVVGLNRNTKTIYVAGFSDNRENLLVIVKDDSSVSTTPSPTPTPISIEPPIPSETPVPVETPIISTEPTPEPSCESPGELVARAEDLLFDLIDSMRSLAHDIRVSRPNARRVIRFARRILREIDLQRANCTQRIASLLDRMDNEIFELGELNHPGIDDELGGNTEDIFDELSEILELDCNGNGITDVCESLN